MSVVVTGSLSSGKGTTRRVVVVLLCYGNVQGILQGLARHAIHSHMWRVVIFGTVHRQRVIESLNIGAQIRYEPLGHSGTVTSVQDCVFLRGGGGLVTVSSAKENITLADILGRIESEYGDGTLSSERTGSLTMGISPKYHGSFDIELFRQRIEGTQDSISQSFAMIQSSGMGKTKLMKKYKTRFSKIHNFTALMLLCTEGTDDVPANFLDHFDSILDVNERKNIIQQLGSLIPHSTVASTSKVLLLVDQAQLLTRKDPDFYVAMRWWLRQFRSTLQIVAVFCWHASEPCQL